VRSLTAISDNPLLAMIVAKMTVKRQTRALGDIPPILPPHESVPYGHLCYRQCYQEMLEYISLAQKGAYFVQQIGVYNTANLSMSDCLNGMPS